MGKIYTFIYKDQTNTKVKTSELQKYLDDGWKIGSWNREELSRNSGAGVKKFYQDLKDSGKWEEYRLMKSHKATEGLKKFWKSVSDTYIEEREAKRAESRNNWSQDELDLYKQRMSESAKRNRATITDEEYSRRSVLSTATKKRNGSFSQSKYEKIIEKLLLDNYGKNDIYTEYIDIERYPFKCDFYIKSLDLFIELNIHPSHGNHHFDSNNLEDIKLKENLISINDDWSNMILDVWCNRDIKKFDTAHKNSLNYIAVYSNTYEEFINAIKENKLCDLMKQK